MSGGWSVSGGPGENRGQLLLVAAGVIAVALLPVIVAYVQLGYGGVATTEPTTAAPGDDALRALERSTYDAAVDHQGVRAWSQRSDVAAAVASEFDRRTTSIETADVDGGRIHEVEREPFAAVAWANQHCPDGPNREFGPCEATDGVVVQERAGTVHVLAVAVTVRTVADAAEHEGTYVFDAAVGGRASEG